MFAGFQRSNLEKVPHFLMKKIKKPPVSYHWSVLVLAHYRRQLSNHFGFQRADLDELEFLLVITLSFFLSALLLNTSISYSRTRPWKKSPAPHREHFGVQHLAQWSLGSALHR